MTNMEIQYQKANPIPSTTADYGEGADLLERQPIEGAGSTSPRSWLGTAAPVRQWYDLSAATGTNSPPVIPVRPDEQEFNTVITRIFQAPEDEDDFKPSDDALRTASALVYEANKILEGSFARASVAVDEDGAIYIYWRKPERTIELAISAQKQGPHHIYHREGTSHGVERNVTAATLAQWLEWFMRV